MLSAYYWCQNGRTEKERLYPDCSSPWTTGAQWKLWFPKCPPLGLCWSPHLLLHSHRWLGATFTRTGAPPWGPRHARRPEEVLGAWLREGSEQQCALRPQMQRPCIVRGMSSSWVPWDPGPLTQESCRGGETPDRPSFLYADGYIQMRKAGRPWASKNKLHAPLWEPPPDASDPGRHPGSRHKCATLLALLLQMYFRRTLEDMNQNCLQDPLGIRSHQLFV